MAAVDGRSSGSSQLICKRCGKNVVKNIIKCEKCSSAFHQSCAKYSKSVKVISDDLINCCGVETSDATEAFFDAMESVSTDSKIDINIFTYIVKQKDALIFELQDKIKILIEYILILNKKTSNEDCEGGHSNYSDSTAAKTVVDKSCKKGSVKMINKQVDTVSSCPQIEKQKQRLDTVLDHTKQKLDNTNLQESGKQISAEILNIQTKLKCDEIINLTNDDQQSTSSRPKATTPKSTEENWKEVTYNRSANYRKRIIGNNKDSSIKGVRKLAHLHVSRVDRETSIAEFKELLKKSFPEVQCELLNAKYPNIYSSFKVTIFEQNFRKAMNPKLWPDGACICRFFQKRITESSIK